MVRKYFIILAFVGFLLYLPSLFGPFIWDDEDFVYANKYVENFQVGKFFTTSITEGRGKGSNYFRPVQEIVYASIHSLFGFNPFWYHLVNAAVHIAAAWAIFYFFLLITNNSITSLLISSAFLVHPVQTEAVSYVSGLSDPLYVLFGFLGLIFFLRKRRWISLLFFLLSLLSKESGVVFLGLISLLFFLQELTTPKPHDRYIIVRLIPGLFKKTWQYFAVTTLYLWYHVSFINTVDIKSAWGNNPFSNSVLVRLLTFIQNLYTYVGLLIFPKDLFMERDYTIHVQTQIFNPYLIIFIIVTALIIYILRKISKDYSPLTNPVTNNHLPTALLVFCFLAFFCSFLPYTGLVLINGIFYEHFLYLPLVFFFAFWIFLLSELARHSSSRLARLNKIALGGAILFLLALVIRNIARQLDWADAVRFYSQTLSHAPKSVRIINGLGMAYADSGSLDKAIATYSLIPPINPNIPNAYHNMANAYAAKGDIQNAEKYYLKAIEVGPKFFFSYQSLANLYQQTGQKDKLQKLLEKYRSLNLP